MSYGMTYRQFWQGDVAAHKQYRKAYELKRVQENTMLWLQGRYVYEAICATAPILRAFSKARVPNDYLKEPFDITAEQRKARAEREARERYERIQRNVAAFAKVFNAEREKERSDQTGEGEELHDGYGRTQV